MYLSQVMHLSCPYRPPNENIRDFIEFLDNKIFPLIPNTLNSILCGDFNVNLYNPLHLTSIDEFVNSRSGQGYFPFIMKPTAKSVTKYSLLNEMWCNYSDHMPCYYIYEFLEKIQNLIRKSSPLVQLHQQICLCGSFCFQNISESISKFFETMHKVYHESFYIRKIAMTTRSKSPWLSRIGCMLLKKNRLYKLFNMDYS